MGIDYRAAIVVGLPREQVETCDPFAESGSNGFWEWMEDNDMSPIAPYYDGYDESLIGYIYKSSPRYGRGLLQWAERDVEDLKDKFKRVTGKDAEVYLSVYGY